eukprot:2393867-Amphidinium_carterae.2
MERIGPPFARRGFAPKQRCCVLALCSAALFTCFETHGGETSAWLPAFVSATTSRGVTFVSQRAKQVYGLVTEVGLCTVHVWCGARWDVVVLRMNCSRIGILPLQRGCRDNVIERHAQHRSGAGGVPGARHHTHEDTCWMKPSAAWGSNYGLGQRCDCLHRSFSVAWNSQTVAMEILCTWELEAATNPMEHVGQVSKPANHTHTGQKLAIRSRAGGFCFADPRRPARGAIFTQLFASDSRPVVLA